MTDRILVAFTCVAAMVAAADRFPEQPQDSQPIREEQYRQMDRYVMERIAKSDGVRSDYWKRLDFRNPAAYERSVAPYRQDWLQYLGVPDPGATPLNVKRVKVREFETHTAYRVWFDTLPGVQAYGILLIPKQPAGRKPALICLHGHLGTPEIVAGFLPEKPDIYKVFGRTAALRGYVVWCPYILSFYSEEHEPKVQAPRGAIFCTRKRSSQAEPC